MGLNRLATAFRPSREVSGFLSRVMLVWDPWVRLCFPRFRLSGLSCVRRVAQARGLSQRRTMSMLSFAENHGSEAGDL